MWRMACVDLGRAYPVIVAVMRHALNVIIINRWIIRANKHVHWEIDRFKDLQFIVILACTHADREGRTEVRIR